MLSDHPVDIKAAIQKRFGSVAAFERIERLPARSVKDVLLRRSRPRIARVIAAAVGAKPHKLFPDLFSPTGEILSRRERAAHRQNTGRK